MRRRTATQTTTLFTLVAIVLGGCSTTELVTGGTPKSQVFDLTLGATEPAATKRRAKNLQLVVYEPTTLRSLDGDRVVVRLASAEISNLEGALWSDRLPVLVQTRMIEALSRAGNFRGVGNGRDKVDPDVSVSTTIQAFQVEHSEKGDVARIGLNIKLVEERSGSVIATRTFNGTSQVKSKEPASHVGAINDAFEAVAVDIVKWVAGIKLKGRPDRPSQDRDRGRADLGPGLPKRG